MKTRRILPGDLVLIALGLLPLLGFFLSDGLAASSDPATLLRWLGRLAGVIGLVCMLLAAMGSIRLPRLDLWFGGLPRFWRLHRLLGFLGFIFILLHVWLLGFASAARGLSSSMASLFPPLTAWPVWAGWLALVLLVVFLTPTFQFFGRLHYQRWKKLHLLSAPTLVFALAHTLALAASQWMWWLLGFLAVGAIVWRKVLSPQWGRLDYTVAKVERLKHDVVELGLKPVSRSLRYMPGQFVYLTPLDPSLSAGFKEEHPYTISSAPQDSELRLGIKNLGDASGALQNISIGSRVQVEGPYGDFYRRRWPDRPQLWLAGGIGITPFVSGARAMAQEPKGAAHLFYLARDEHRSYYLDELLQIASQVKSFEATAHYFWESGAITVDFLELHCPDFRNREVYMCGPPGMVSHLVPLLRSAGIPSSAIHSEVFDFL